MLSVEFHVSERNGELSQSLSLCKRQQSRAVWYSYSFCVIKTAALQGRCDKANVYGALSECCTVFRGLSAEWHSYKLSEIQTNYSYSLSVLQVQIDSKCPNNTLLPISDFPIQIYCWQPLTDKDRSRECLIGHTVCRTGL